MHYYSSVYMSDVSARTTAGRRTVSVMVWLSQMGTAHGAVADWPVLRCQAAGRYFETTLYCCVLHYS
jgi:hypothetical protein